MVSFKLRGLVPPVFTPFNEEFTLNLNVIPHYVKYLKSKGVEGFLVNSTTGEGVSMSCEERMSVTEEWVREGRAEGMHVMVQVGGGALTDVLKLAQHAEKCGAHSILTLPELFFKPSTVTDLVDYLQLVSEEAPNTPLLYYHIPAFTNVNLNMALMVREAQKRVKTFRGVKLTSPNLEEAAAVLKECSGETKPFLGCDTLLVAAKVLGIDSSIGTTFNMFYEDAKLIVMEASEELTLKEIVGKQRKLTRIVEIITKYGAWVPSMKAAMKIISGIDVGPVRPPNKSLTPEQFIRMAADLVAEDCI